MIKPLVIAGLLVLPAVARAASFKEFVDKSLVPLGDLIVTLLYAVAFLLFLVGLVRYMFSYNEEQRQKGKSFALWGIIGLVVLFSVWGLVKALVSVVASGA